MDAGSEPRFCPAGPALLVAALLLLVLLGAALLVPDAAVVLFMAVPALLALALLRKARDRMRRRGKPPE